MADERVLEKAALAVKSEEHQQQQPTDGLPAESLTSPSDPINVLGGHSDQIPVGSDIPSPVPGNTALDGTGPSNQKSKGNGIDDVEKGSIHLPEHSTVSHPKVKQSNTNTKLLDGLMSPRLNATRLRILSEERLRILSFEDLHRLNIRQRQLKLLEFSQDSKMVPGDDLHQALHNYREALDDLDYFNRLPPPSSRTAESGRKQHGGRMSIVSVGRIGQGQIDSKAEIFRLYLNMGLHAFIQLSFAVFGGLFLIVPLIIMVYVPGRTAKVITTCVAVFGFAAQLAFLSSLSRFVELTGSPLFRKLGITGLNFGSFEPKDIIAATAAYAAVLVVFVGTSIVPS